MAAATKDPSVLWALLGFDGRISREVYWLATGFCVLLMFAVAMPSVDEASGTPQFSPAFPFVLMASLWTQFSLTVKRLHDRGLSGWLSLVMAVPFINFFGYVVIGLLPGDPGRNQFGPGPNTRGV